MSSVSQNPDRAPSRRDDLLLMLLHGGAATNAIAAHVVDAFAAEIRAEIVADIHRAELPKFPADETPEIVAKTVRAIDVRLAAQGSDAPYYMAKGDVR